MLIHHRYLNNKDNWPIFDLIKTKNKSFNFWYNISKIKYDKNCELDFHLNYLYEFVSEAFWWCLYPENNIWLKKVITHIIKNKEHWPKLKKIHKTSDDRKIFWRIISKRKLSKDFKKEFKNKLKNI
jgi:hypothetical protein